MLANREISSKRLQPLPVYRPKKPKEETVKI